MRRRMHVRSAEGPSRKQRAVLLEENTVLDQRERQQQIGKSPSPRAMFSDLHVSSPAGRGLQTLRVKAAFAFVEGSVADVTEIDVAHERVRLSHALQSGDRRDPKHKGQADSP